MQQGLSTISTFACCLHVNWTSVSGFSNCRALPIKIKDPAAQHISMEEGN